MQKKFLTRGTMTKIVILLCYILFCIYSSVSINVFANDREISLIIDGNKFENLPSSPVIIADCVLVPIREVLEHPSFNAQLYWDENLRQLNINTHNVNVLLNVDDKIALVNGVEKTMATPATIINNKLMVPIRFLAETFGFEVIWDSESYSVIINSKNKSCNITSIDRQNNYLYKIKADSEISSFNSFSLSGNRFVIDIGDSSPNFSGANKTDIDINDGTVIKIRVAQNQTVPVKITRIVFDLESGTSCNAKLSNDKNYISISLQQIKTTCKNISCKDNLITLKKQNGLPTLNNIYENDSYDQKKYTLKFPSSLENIFNNGQFFIGNDYFSHVQVQNNTLTVHENRILVYSISEDNNNIYIKGVSPKEIYKHIFVIDAGHGGIDTGTSSNNVKEKDLNFDIVQKVLDMFKYEDGIKVYSTRLTDTKISLDDRCEIANDIGDLFISVHINSAPNPEANGTEVYYYPHENDSQTKFSSQQLAQTLLDNLTSKLQSANRGIKTAPFVVIKKTNIPAVLCEIGFLSNVNEFEKLCDDNYRMKTAEAIYDTVKFLTR